MRKNAKRRSFGRRFFDACLTGVSRIALAVGDMVARNPVVAGGATAFLVTFGFVASNAIWYQPQAHDSVFFKTRPDQVFHAAVRDDDAYQRLTGMQKNVRDGAAPGTIGSAHSTVAVLPNTTVDGGDLPALAPNGDKDVAILQYNLKRLGFYDGGVDGLTGPQTRKALEQWQSVQAKIVPVEQAKSVQVPVSKPTETVNDESLSIADAIAVATPESKPALIVQKPSRSVPTQVAPQAQSVTAKSASAQSVSAEELVRIQAGLKAFGNDMVVVDGMPGKTTEDAIREFQKLFRLNVSGKPDPELIGKMREIGLIS